MTRRLPALLAAAAVVAALAGCAPAAPEPDGLRIVASTNVYGDLAAAIAGDAATVTSIIDGPAQDPHSYEASARDRLALADADLVVYNGGGYDPFVEALLGASGEAEVLEAVAIAGYEGEAGEHAHDDHGHLEGVNEHVWYSIPAMEALAAAITDTLSALDPAHADDFAANHAALADRLAALEARTAVLHEQLEGTGVALTEPVPAHLFAALGLDDLTPPEFAEAIEEDAGVPPLALEELLDLIASGRVALLGYNAQTAGPETERVRAAAETAGIPVVDFTETLPEGADYVSWMTANVEAIAAALS